MAKTLLTILLITLLCIIRFSFTITLEPARLMLESTIWLLGALAVRQGLDPLLRFFWGGHKHLPKFLSDLSAVVIFSIATLCIFAFVFQRSVSGLLATSGLVVAILGFALQSTFSNIFSGMALNIASPFEMGDWIRLSTGQVGKVIEFNWRETRLLTINGIMIVIPNGKLAEYQFENLNRPQCPYRMTLPVQVDYSAPSERVYAVLNAALKETNGLDGNFPSLVHIESLEADGVQYTVNYWVPNYPESFHVTSSLITNVLNHLNQAGLAAAYPKRDVYLIEDHHNRINRNYDRISLLGRVALFRELEQADLEALAAAANLLTFKSDQTIFSEGQKGDSLFVIVSGIVGVFKHHDQREQVVAKLSPGAFFGELSLLTGEVRNATVKALTSLTLLEIKMAHFKPILQKTPALLAHISSVSEQRRLSKDPQSQLSAEPTEVSEHRVAKLRRKIKQFFQLG